MLYLSLSFVCQNLYFPSFVLSATPINFRKFVITSDFFALPKMASDPKKQDKKGGKAPDPQEILAGFQALRAEQRTYSTKLSELELDQNEHKTVIETLKNVHEDRRCFRLIGGVLTERKVKDVLPVLLTNQEKLKEFTDKLNEKITQKGQEINEYREKYNIRFRGLDNPKQEAEEQAQAVESSRGNVLVS